MNAERLLTEFLQETAHIIGMDWTDLGQRLVLGGVTYDMAHSMIRNYGMERAKGELIAALQFAGLNV